MENIGLFDFLGFDLASLAAQHSKYGHGLMLPSIVGGTAADARDGMGNTSAFIITLKSFVGVGILTIPFAVQKGGFVLGPVSILIVAFLSHHCMELLLHLGETTCSAETVSFGTLGMQICGRWAKVLVESCLVVTQYACAITDLIFIVESMRDVLCHETHGVVCPTKSSVCTWVLVFLLPLTWLRSLNLLTVPVLMSNLALFSGISWVSYCNTEQLVSAGVAPGVVAFNWAELPVLFGCAVFSFEGIGLVLPIQLAMAEPTAYPRILRRSMILLGTLFATFGLFGYLAYGAGTHDMIVINVPQNRIMSFLRLFYCFGIFFTYPVMLFPLYQVTESNLRFLKNNHGCWRRVLYRTVLVVFTGLIGLIGMQIPHFHFGLFLGLVGSVACSLLAFVLPALFHLRRFNRTDGTRLGDIKDMGIIAFGVICGSVSFYVTFGELLKGMSG